MINWYNQGVTILNVSPYYTHTLSSDHTCDAQNPK